MNRLYVGGLGNKPEIVSDWKHGSMPNMKIEIRTLASLVLGGGEASALGAPAVSNMI